MIPRLKCKTRNPQRGEINFSEYEFLLFQLGTWLRCIVVMLTRRVRLGASYSGSLATFSGVSQLCEVSGPLQISFSSRWTTCDHKET